MLVALLGWAYAIENAVCPEMRSFLGFAIMPPTHSLQIINTRKSPIPDGVCIVIDLSCTMVHKNVASLACVWLEVFPASS